MVIKNVNDIEFKKYGRVLNNYDVKELLNKMEATPLPEGVIYEPSIKELENLDVAKEFKNREFGGLDIQIGYCNGNNYMLNAVEYHRTSEINIAVTDLILLLGLEQDIEDDYSYDTSKIEAIFVPAGTAIEVYGTTLHYAPCNAKAGGFRCVVVLPKGTNEALPFAPEAKGESRLLTAVNKWLIAHEDAEIEGAVNGLKGENITIV